MTELTITPKVADKTARFKGTVAAGEHVAVTIKGGAAWLGEDDGANLTLRVLDLVTGRTLAVFPRPQETMEEGETPDAWSADTEDENDLYCELNLNTTRMVNAARHMLRVPVLFVLSDTDDPRTLYFRDRYEVGYWPERIGDTAPYDLDNWPKQIDEWTELVAEFGTRLDTAEADIGEAKEDVEEAVGRVSAALDTAGNFVDRSELAATNAQAAAAEARDWAGGAVGDTPSATNNAKYHAEQAATKAGEASMSATAANGSASDAATSATNAEKWATGGAGGTPSATNNAKYYAEQAEEILEDKADKVASATNGNFAGLDSNGNLTDSGKKATDFAPATDIAKSALASDVQTSLGKADSAVQSNDILSDGKIKTALLPSFVDDVLEYSSLANFPATGETGKIYVANDTNNTYRWGGSSYVEISASLALGETSSTAYRGDRGKTAYDHATDSNRLTTARSSGFYKIATTAEGHVKSATAVEKSDITALGIPAQDTTYPPATPSTSGVGGTAGLMSAADKEKLDGIAVALDGKRGKDDLAFDTDDWFVTGGTIGRLRLAKVADGQWAGTQDNVQWGLMRIAGRWYFGKTATPSYGGYSDAAADATSLSITIDGTAYSLAKGDRLALVSEIGEVDISGKANKSEMSVTPGTGADADKATIQLKSGTSATVLTAHQDIGGKANAADLPYAMVTPGEWEFSDGQSHTVYGPTEGLSGWFYMLDDEQTGDYSNYFSTESEALAALSLTFLSVTATRASLPGHLLDRVNNLIDATTGNVTLTLPPFVAGKVRDLLVACTIGLDGNDEPWSVIFQGADGEGISFKAEGNEAASATFPVPDATGDWWYSLTERAPHVFAVSLKHLQSVSQQGGS